MRQALVLRGFHPMAAFLIANFEILVWRFQSCMKATSINYIHTRVPTGSKILGGGQAIEESVPILGLLEVAAELPGGRMVIFGDSNCIDSTHSTSCKWPPHAH